MWRNTLDEIICSKFPAAAGSEDSDFPAAVFLPEEQASATDEGCDTWKIFPFLEEAGFLDGFDFDKDSSLLKKRNHNIVEPVVRKREIAPFPSGICFSDTADGLSAWKEKELLPL